MSYILSDMIKVSIVVIKGLLIRTGKIKCTFPFEGQLNQIKIFFLK